MATRDVGLMGEAHFMAWCGAVGIVANRAERDRTGWDFHIEFPLPHDVRSPIPLDLQGKAIRGLVQVKATDRRGASISVKLDNWLRMVQESLPAFFLVLEYDGAANPERAYLVHVGESHIRNVQKRAREVSASGSSEPLHQRTMRLKYRAEDQLITTDGAGLEEAIRRHVGDDVALYELAKRRLIETVGYEDGVGELRIQMLLPAEDPDRHLVDFALGRVDSLPLAGGEYRDVRFGIAEQGPGTIFPAGSTLRGARVSQETSLRFRAAQRTARMRAAVYSPVNVSHLVKRDSLRVRIANPFLEMVASLAPDAECQISLTRPDANATFPLAEGAGFADFLLLNDGGVVRGEQVELRFALSGREIVQRFAAFPVREDFVAWARLIRAAWTVADRLGLPHDSAVSNHEIISQGMELNAASAALHGVPPPFSITVAEDLDVPRGETRVPWLQTLRLGEHRILLPTVYFGIPVPAGSPEPGQVAYSVIPTGVEVVGERLLLPGEAFGREEHLGALEAIATTDDQSPFVWRWWRPPT